MGSGVSKDGCKASGAANNNARQPTSAKADVTSSYRRNSSVVVALGATTNSTSGPSGSDDEVDSPRQQQRLGWPSSAHPTFHQHGGPSAKRTSMTVDDESKGKRRSSKGAGTAAESSNSNSNNNEAHHNTEHKKRSMKEKSMRKTSSTPLLKGTASAQQSNVDGEGRSFVVIDDGVVDVCMLSASCDSSFRSVHGNSLNKSATIGGGGGRQHRFLAEYRLAQAAVPTRSVLRGDVVQNNDGDKQQDGETDRGQQLASTPVKCNSDSSGSSTMAAPGSEIDSGFLHPPRTSNHNAFNASWSTQKTTSSGTTTLPGDESNSISSLFPPNTFSSSTGHNPMHLALASPSAMNASQVSSISSESVEVNSSAGVGYRGRCGSWSSFSTPPAATRASSITNPGEDHHLLSSPSPSQHHPSSSDAIRQFFKTTGPIGKLFNGPAAEASE